MTGKKCCENCGNYRCSQSVVAIYYDYCYGDGMKYWMPKIQAVEDVLSCKRKGRRTKRKLSRAKRAFQSVRYKTISKMEITNNDALKQEEKTEDAE